MGALVLAQIPDADVAAAITGNELSLVGMNDDVVDGMVVIVIALNAGGPGVPDLDGAVLGAGHHPLALAVKSDPGDIGGVTVKSQHRVRIGGTDVVEFDVLIAGRSEPALVGGDAQSIDLRVWVLDGARADSGEGFPEADGMVVTGRTEDDRHTCTPVACDWAINCPTPVGILHLGLARRFL